MPGDDAEVLCTRQGSVLELMLNRPAKLNAINYDMIATLMTELDEAAEDPSVRAVVLSGAGRAFSAGDDLNGMGDPRYGVPPGEHPVRHMQQRLIRALFWYPKPTIASLHGNCHGFAHDLALSADLRVVADDVVFGDLRIRRALPVGSGATWLLPRLVGLSKATSIMLTGATIGAEEMRELGLAHDVVSAGELAAATAELATSLAAGPTKALGLLKRELRSNLTVGLGEALDLEISLMEEPVKDRKEGVKSFLEKRTPNYSGE